MLLVIRDQYSVQTSLLSTELTCAVTKTRNHPKPAKTTQNHLHNQQNQPKRPKTTYTTNKTNQTYPKPATIYPNTTGLRDICVDGRL